METGRGSCWLLNATVHVVVAFVVSAAVTLQFDASCFGGVPHLGTEIVGGW